VVQTAWADAEIEVEGVRCLLVREPGDPFVRLPGGRTVRRRPRRVLERVAELAPDLIHLEGLVLPRAVRALAAAVPRVPIVAQVHGTKFPPGCALVVPPGAPLAGVAFGAQANDVFVAAGVRRDLLFSKSWKFESVCSGRRGRAFRHRHGRDPCPFGPGTSMNSDRSRSWRRCRR
jgi:hypothetical protein